MNSHHIPDSLARWLITHAARLAPHALAERLEEEWLAALEERRGAIARLRLAFGCCWATGVIAHEQATVAALAATSPASPNLLGGLWDERSRLQRRTAVILVIVCLHVLAISALVTGLAWTEIPHPEAETMVDLTFG